MFDDLYSFKYIYVAYSVDLRSASIWSATYLSCWLPSTVHFFQLPRIVLTKVGLLHFVYRTISSIGAFLSNVLLFKFIFHSSSLFFYLSILRLLYYFSLPNISHAVPDNDFSNFAKVRCLKIASSVVVYKEQDCNFNDVGSEINSSEGVTCPDEI